MSISAITAPFLSPAPFLLIVLPLPLVAAGVDPARALLVGSALESAIVLLQFFGNDPLSPQPRDSVRCPWCQVSLQQAARAGSGTQVAAQVEVLFRDAWL